jgi:molybdate transport system regulatory protein
VSRIRLGIYLGESGEKLGPGKIRLLEAIDERGSISAAARALGLAYRHAWERVDGLNRCFGAPVVAASTGGRIGGGAALTPLGRELVRRYRSMEAATAAVIARDLRALERRRASRSRRKPRSD